jgi:histidinol-phosphate aminotransferase
MISCLRNDLPPNSTFTVTEKPWRAKLDQNEAPVDLPDELKTDLARALAAGAWNRYPQPSEYAAAKARFGQAVGVPAENLALTVGCDQVIQAAFLLAGGPGRRARWFEPTYPNVALASRITGTLGEGIVLGETIDEAIDPGQVTAPPAPHLIVLVAPNNPTGGAYGREALDAALADPDRLVLVDEAYADFSGESVIAEALTRPNLLVGRSLSKSLLAGVRLGWAVGHPEAIAALERIYTSPYHLNSLQILVASRYGEIKPHLERAAAMVRSERERVAAALQGLDGITVRPSRANFLLFGIADASSHHTDLADRGVRIRDVSELPGLSSHLRVTIGTPAENDLFLATLGDLLKGAGGA